MKESLNPTDLDNVNWQEISIGEQTKEYFMYEHKLKGGEIYFQYKLRLNTGGTGTGPIVKSVEFLKN